MPAKSSGNFLNREDANLCVFVVREPGVSRETSVFLGQKYFGSCPNIRWQQDRTKLRSRQIQWSTLRVHQNTDSAAAKMRKGPVDISPSFLHQERFSLQAQPDLP